jgi:hypothetical protein
LVQIFYNSTSGTFKTVKPGGVPAGTWASGGNLNTARGRIGGAGTQTAAIVMVVIRSTLVLTEYYNGTAWTEVS